MRVELARVGKSYPLPLGSVTVLQDIYLLLEEGEQCLITGPAGSGKTTLLNIMGGVASPTWGSVSLAGVPLRRGERLRRGVSYLFQEAHFFSQLTVLENLLLPLLHRREEGGLHRGEELLDRFGLTEFSDLSPSLLSRGEQLRLGIARALLDAPRLLLLDEPFSMLDPLWQGRVLELVLEQCRGTQTTLVMAMAASLPGVEQFRQIRLFKGKVISDGIDNH